MIPDSGPPYVWLQIAADDRHTLRNAFKDASVTAGWTATEMAEGSAVLTFTGVPANGQTCTFDSVAYTFRTVLTQGTPREVQIGANAAACASNLTDAVNANPATSGVAYSSSTTAHPTCNAVLKTAAVWIFGPPLAAVSEVLNNATFNRATLTDYGWYLDSAICPSGLQMRLWLLDNGTYFKIVVSDCQTQIYDLPIFGHILLHAVGRLLEFYGCKHQIFVCLQGTSAENGCIFTCGTPSPLPGCAAPKITSISNNSGNFQITTLTPHGFATGEHIYIAAATKDTRTGVSAINGNWQITVIDSTNYVLDASAYTAESYDADSGLSGSQSLTARCFWAVGNMAEIAAGSYANSQSSFRTTLGQTGAGWCFHVAYNQYKYYSNTVGNVSCVGLKLPKFDDTTGTHVANIDNSWDFCESRLCWPIVSLVSSKLCVGLLWNCAVITKAYDMDIIKNNYQGFNWRNFTTNTARGSLWLITGQVA